MRKVKVDKETYLVLRKLKLEENRQIPDILAEAVENYAKNRRRKLARLAKKAMDKLKPTKKEDPPKTEATGKGPDVEKETSPEGGDEQPPE